ncbi:hypothetical protein ASF16_21075, partial [Acidovorax sp. Leaf78]
MQPGLRIKLLSLQADGLMDAVGVVLLLDLAPGAVSCSPTHLSRLFSVGVDQRNGCAQVVRQEVPDGQRVVIFDVGLGVLDELQRLLHLASHLLR